MAVSGVSREAARTAALADSAAEAEAVGMARGQDVAAGYGLGNGTLELAVDPGDFARGGRVEASARYTVALDDLPLLGWASVTVSSDHLEGADLYRSRGTAEGSG